MKIKLNLSKNSHTQESVDAAIYDFLESCSEEGDRDTISIIEERIKLLSNRKTTWRLVYNISETTYIKLKELFRGRSNKPIRVERVIEAILTKHTTELQHGSQLFLAAEGWQREVSVGAGRIDGLNHKTKQVVELKFLEHWKAALGQILAYAENYPKNYSKEIWLLAKKPPSNSLLKDMKEVCNKYDVKVKIIEV